MIDQYHRWREQIEGAAAGMERIVAAQRQLLSAPTLKIPTEGDVATRGTEGGLTSSGPGKAANLGRSSGGGSGGGGGGGGRFAASDQDSVILTSIDGSLTTSLRIALLAVFTYKVGAIIGYQPPGTNAVIRCYDLTILYNDARAIFPAAQGAEGGTRTLSAGSKSGGAPAVPRNPGIGGGAGGTGGGGGGSSKGGEIVVNVQPPRLPTPGELLITGAIDRQTGVLERINRAQAVSDGGLDLRRKRL